MIHIFTTAQAEQFVKNPPSCRTDYQYGPEPSSLPIGSVITKAISQAFPEYKSAKAYVASMRFPETVISDFRYPHVKTTSLEFVNFYMWRIIRTLINRKLPFILVDTYQHQTFLNLNGTKLLKHRTNFDLVSGWSYQLPLVLFNPNTLTPNAKDISNIISFIMDLKTTYKDLDLHKDLNFKNLHTSVKLNGLKIK